MALEAWSKGLSWSGCSPLRFSEYQRPSLHFQDEDAVLGEEDEVDFGATLGFVVGEAEGVEADPMLGVGGVADDFVHAALGVALDGRVDGGGDHAGHDDCSPDNRTSS
jgi:hypothetical protein